MLARINRLTWLAVVGLMACAASSDDDLAAEEVDTDEAPLIDSHEADDDDDDELEGRAPTDEELKPSVEAAFGAESYVPGAAAQLRIFNKARDVTYRIFHVGPETEKTVGNSEMRGVPVSDPIAAGDVAKGTVLRVQLQHWGTGLYFARLHSADGRVGFAPFAIRPLELGRHRVAVVMPTLTWQAYNLRDDNGDGAGDSWYAKWSKKKARLYRPFLNRGVPYHFRSYDLPFLHWLDKHGHAYDCLTDEDLDQTNAATLARAYDLIVFPGHHEYVTTREYDAVEGYRDRGGNLMFLSANNFFWRVIKDGDTIEKTKQWRDLGRPEAALIGVQYRGNGKGRGPWRIRAAPATGWVFEGTGLGPGQGFVNAGIEIDGTAPSSPDGIQILAEIPNIFGPPKPGKPPFTAQMTFYKTPAGAKVFAAGAFTMAGGSQWPQVSKVLENLWAKMAVP